VIADLALWTLAQLTVGFAAAAAVGPRTARKAAAGLLVAAGLALPWFAPPVPLFRAGVTLVALTALIKTILLLATPGPWTLQRRLWNSFAPFDIQHARAVAPALDRRLLLATVLHAALFALALLALILLRAHDGTVRDVLRVPCGAVFVYTLVDTAAGAATLVHHMAGVAVPVIQDHPVLSRSVAEFWGERWNREMGDWLRQLVFRPLRRRHDPRLALLATFAVSAAIHAWLFLVPLDAAAALSAATFFLVQPALIFAEKAARVSAWPPVVARAWTVGVLVGSSWLFTDPMLSGLGL